MQMIRKNNNSFSYKVITLDNKVLALYGLGMSYEAISEHLADMYGLEVSSAKISLITDRLLPLITEWRNRSLESVYEIF